MPAELWISIQIPNGSRKRLRFSPAHWFAGGEKPDSIRSQRHAIYQLLRRKSDLASQHTARPNQSTGQMLGLDDLTVSSSSLCFEVP
jgi:hypothetical protein